MITVVTSPGCICTVSFQPSSFGSGPRATPVGVNTPFTTLNGCRDSTWTFTRWKWIGWVSAVRLKMRQTSTAPAVGVSVVGAR